MDIMTMMKQIDKLPEFHSNYNDFTELPSYDFSDPTNVDNILGNIPHHIENVHANSSSSSSFISLQSTIPLTNVEPVKELEVEAEPTHFLYNSSTMRWRNELAAIEKAYQTPLQKQSSSAAAMREMIFRMAMMQPIQIDPEAVKPPKRRNVKISKDPQSVAARHRRERISERIRILQRLVPGGTKMDTASMLDEAIHYVKFLKTQLQSLERAAPNRPTGIGFPVAMSSGSN